MPALRGLAPELVRHRRGVFRIDDWGKNVKLWQQAKVLKYATSSHPGGPVRGDVDVRMRTKGEKIHCGATPLVGWSHAAYGDQWAEGAVLNLERTLSFPAVGTEVRGEICRKQPGWLSSRI